MDCRYHISPSVLYSLLGRQGSASSNGAIEQMDGDYEVPVYGDWVLFAVVGEKSSMKYTALSEPNSSSEHSGPQSARKYFSCKLLDLNTKLIGKHNQLPGHCKINMMVFESDSQRNGSDGTIQYYGGSRGALELLWKEREGMLLAILNPKIMKKRKSVRARN